MVPTLLEFLSHFFQNSLTKNFKNNFFTVFNLLAHWHLFAFDCFRAKKVTQNFWILQDPPPFWKNTIKKQIFFVGWLPFATDKSNQVPAPFLHVLREDVDRNLTIQGGNPEVIRSNLDINFPT